MKYFFLALLFASPAHAEYMAINVQPGLDFAKLSETTTNSYTPMHFNFGVTGEYAFLPYLIGESGLRFVQKGTGIRLSVLGIDIDADAKLKYLEVPLYAKMYFLDGSARPFLYLGPTLGFKVGDSVTVSDSSGSTTTTSVFGSSVKSFNMTLDFGTGVRIAFSPKMAALLGVGYSYGLTSISSDSNAKTRDVEINFGVNFVL